MRSFKTLVALTAAVGLVVALFAGCATIIKGSKAKISVNSNPSAATVSVTSTSGMQFFEGKTPANFSLPKKNEYIVTVSLDGYAEETVNITKQGIQGWFWGNILCGGIIGIIVDLTTGAINNLGPEDISVELATAMLPGGESVTYVVFKALDDNGDLRILTVPMQAAGSADIAAH